METAAAPTKVSTKKPKIKLDFKDSKYATGRRKKSNLILGFFVDTLVGAAAVSILISY